MKSLFDDLTRFTRIESILGHDGRVSALRTSDIESLKRTLQAMQIGAGGSARKMAAATVKRHLELLRAALKVAQAHGCQHANPMASVKMPAVRLPQPAQANRLTITQHIC